MHVHHSTPIHPSCIKSSWDSPSPDTAITSIHQHQPVRPVLDASLANQDQDEDHRTTQEVSPQDITRGMTMPHSEVQTTESRKECTRPDTRSTGRSVDWSDTAEDQPTEEAVLQISGVDSGSAVTALSCKLYQTLMSAGALVGVLRPTGRKLRGANGSPIEILGCSSCVVSFLGLRTEFPVLVCDLSTDAIIGTDTLGSILPHTLDIKKGLLFTEGGVSLQLHRRDAALSGRVFTVGHCSIPPWSEAVLHCTTRTVGGRSLPSSGLLEGLTVKERTASSPWDIVRFHHGPRQCYIASRGQWAAGRFRRVACWRVSPFLQKIRAWW